MNREVLMEMYDQFCADGKELIATKNNDYAGRAPVGQEVFGNLLSCEQLGICSGETGILVRITDKIKRINTFLKDGELLTKGESVNDTLLDAHNYIFLLYALIQSRKEAGDG